MLYLNSKMKMLIKPAKYKNKKVIQKVCISYEVHGCDECRTEIKEYPNEPTRLEINVFHHDNSEINHYHFCSWKCALTFIPKIKTDYFIDLPFVHFDSGVKERSAAELIRILSSIKQ